MVRDHVKLNLIAYRDHLFDKYLSVLDKYEKWKSGEAPMVIGRVTGEKTTRKELAFMIKNHLMELSAQLRDLDEKISVTRSPDDLYHHIRDVY